MKNIYLLFFACLFLAAQTNAQQVWDNFENIRKGTYGFINGTFIPYSTNPAQTGVNPSPVAAQYFRNPAEQFDVIILDGQMENLADYVAGTKKLSIKVWSPAAGKTVQISLENSVLAEPTNFPTGRHSAYLATTTTSMAWETLTFNFDTQPDPTVANDNVDRMVLLFDPNTNNGDEWWFDDLTLPALVNDPCAGVAVNNEILMDFECQQNLSFTFSHSGVNFRRVLNPDATGANTSSYVATYTRNAGEENDVIIAKPNMGDGINIFSGDVISLNVWDPTPPTDVIVSLQDAAGNIIIAPTSNTSVGSTWETLNFDVSSVAGAFVEQIVILFDPGNFSSDLYYWDNLQFGGSVNTFETLAGVNDFVASPNPAQDFANFNYELQTAAQVNLSVFDHTGRFVANVFDGLQNAGNQQLNWETDHTPSGMYFYSLSVNGQVATGKLIITK